MDAGDDDRTAPAARAPFPDSLCHGCAFHRYVEGRATVFVRCTALAVKYPPQPVRRCAAFAPSARDDERGGERFH